MQTLKEITLTIFFISLSISFISGTFLLLYYIYEIIKEEKDLYYKLKKDNSDLLDEIIMRDCEIKYLKEHLKNQ